MNNTDLIAEARRAIDAERWTGDAKMFAHLAGVLADALEAADAEIEDLNHWYERESFY